MSIRPHRIDRFLWPLMRGWRYAVTLSVFFAGWVGMLLIPDHVYHDDWRYVAIVVIWIIAGDFVNESRVRYLRWRDWLRAISRSRDGDQ